MGGPQFLKHFSDKRTWCFFHCSWVRCGKSFPKPDFSGFLRISFLHITNFVSEKSKHVLDTHNHQGFCKPFCDLLTFPVRSFNLVDLIKIKFILQRLYAIILVSCKLSIYLASLTPNTPLCHTIFPDHWIVIVCVILMVYTLERLKWKINEILLY